MDTDEEKLSYDALEFFMDDLSKSIVCLGG